MIRVVFNQKGGVGKSSITVNLAAWNAHRGRRTLIVDLDPQGNATQYVLGEAAGFARGKTEVTPNIGQFFAQSLTFKLKEQPLSEFVHPTPYDLLHVIPSNPELREIEHLLESKHKIYKLSAALKALSVAYDDVFIDTPPAFNFYTLSALIAADSCLIPFDCDAFSRRALDTLRDNVEETVRDHNDRLKIEGIIINQFQPRSALPVQLVEALKQDGLPVIEPALPSSVIMKASHQQNLPLVHLAPKHKLTLAFAGVLDALQR